MSNEDEQVQIARNNGYKTQWARGLFYKKEGGKFVFKSKYLKLIISSLFILTTIALLFQGPSPTTPDPVTNISQPTDFSSDSTINLEAYNQTKSGTKTTKHKTVVKVERLSLVSRFEKLEIPLGAQARAQLMTGGTNGPIKAKLLEDLSFNGEKFIPEGSTLWGKGASTDERLIVLFSKVVLQDGTSLDIVANAYDISDEILGLKGSIIGRTSKKLLAGAGLGVAGALTTMQSSENIGGLPVVKPSLENALLNGASSAALGMAEQELEELKNKQTIIEVKKGTEIVVVFSKGQ